MELHDSVDNLLGQWSWASHILPLDTMAIAERITRLARHLARQADDVLDPLGLERGEFEVIAALLRAGRPYELARTVLDRLLMIPDRSLTDRLDRLEKRALITRHPADRQLVALTDEGRNLAETAVTGHAKAIAELIDSAPADHRAQLSALLRELLSVAERPR